MDEKCHKDIIFVVAKQVREDDLQKLNSKLYLFSCIWVEKNTFWVQSDDHLFKLALLTVDRTRTTYTKGEL